MFCRLFWNLAKSLLQKLSQPKSKFGVRIIEEYYKQIRNKYEDFVLLNVEVTSVEEILKNLDITKAPGIDQISAKSRKDDAPVIAIHLANITNLSIKLDTFPSHHKIAKIKPLFNKWIKTEVKGCLPIPLLPLISKVIEKPIHDQTQDYVQRNELLYSYQWGFKANHSTDTCLL